MMKILIVDDDQIFRKYLSKALVRRGYEVESVESGEIAIRLVDTLRSLQDSERPFDAAIVDMNMPGMNGLQVIRELKDVNPSIISIILTGYGSISTAVDSIKFGAYHYQTKPCNISTLEKILTDAYREKNRAHEPFQNIYQGIVGKSPKIQNVISTIRKVKDSSLPVLIYGESGTGKELVARALHFDSVKKDGPFIPINCALLKADLLENELFGHVKGAFTGASDIKEGLISVADGGTLFIDEIADMNPAVQSGLLRFIETGIFRPLGSVKERKVNVRIVTAINKDIEAEVKAGRFRHDLYYRLKGCRIDIPPIRERKEDIPELVNYFLNSKSDNRNLKSKTHITPAAMDILLSHPWYGNVRELFHFLETALVLSENNTVSKYLINSLLSRSPEQSRREEKLLHRGQDLSSASLEFSEINHIKEQLEACRWNISRTAKSLGIDRRTLQRKMIRYNIKKVKELRS
ncbi:MAG: sigma-54-dependent Fis family transcriptional regulator [Nitrospinae bacterium]|nr:sigma-54-dependent Fis family transcriptional regulator [Nitrospinota bacterium]